LEDNKKMLEGEIEGMISWDRVLADNDLQDGKLPRLHHEHREQRKTDYEAGQSCQIAGSKN
jgi:hypothetical protein